MLCFNLSFSKSCFYLVLVKSIMMLFDFIVVSWWSFMDFLCLCEIFITRLRLQLAIAHSSFCIVFNFFLLSFGLLGLFFSFFHWTYSFLGISDMIWSCCFVGLYAQGLNGFWSWNNWGKVYIIAWPAPSRVWHTWKNGI